MEETVSREPQRIGGEHLLFNPLPSFPLSADVRDSVKRQWKDKEDKHMREID